VIRALGGCTLVTVGCLAVLAGGAGAALAPPGSSELVRPVEGARISLAFGCTTFPMEPVSPACPTGHMHYGVDLVVTTGTPVHAAAGGTVRVFPSAFGYGLHVLLDHGNGISSLYAHLSAVTAASGDVVAPGEVLGAVGSSGNSTGPHLHFEVRRDGIPEDPQRDIALP
jgi:murein DD-endopeptidase MepM/ murein hydrolase activator NlpD